ncbi:MAG: sodium:alanine symporter [Gemmatimonadota bacterium]|nr:MAG: sodium:alanine symporter [Gemmatimonadota bacterium]
MNVLDRADAILATAVDLAWGLPLVILLIGAGLFFTVVGGLTPLRRWRHALAILSGRFDDERAPGQITHFQALSSALSATLGMGNIAGVAIAVTTGGPGAVFWMWIAGLVGMATKFFTCTLAVLYRKPDSQGVPQGGPMYWIEVGLGRRWRFLGILFSAFGMIGCLALFQINQLAGLLQEHYAVPRLGTGVVAAGLVGVVILGGIVRVGRVAARIVPIMAGLYLVSALIIVGQHAAEVPGILGSIITSAFTGGAALGGAAGVTMKQALITGVRRAAFSNEAGIGTAPLAHGAARTKEPVREGLVAMLGPFIDTNIVCTLTALVILTSGVGGDADGVLLTVQAFEAGIPNLFGLRLGLALLTVVIVLFSVSTLISYSYYSRKCAIYVFGERWGGRYEWVYIASVVLGAVWAQDAVVNLLDTAFALMAIPTVLSALVLSPKVVAATRDYFSRYGD